MSCVVQYGAGNRALFCHSSSPEEIKAPQASEVFKTSSSWHEKAMRIFNNTMFIAYGAQLMKLAPSATIITGRLTKISEMHNPSFLQLPAFVTGLSIVSKILVNFPRFCVFRKILAVFINCSFFPLATLTFAQKTILNVSIDDRRSSLASSLKTSDYVFRRMNLEKSGICYEAFLIGHKDTIENGNWVSISGKGEHSVRIEGGESFADNVNHYLEKFNKLGLNILYVNGPGVGRSSGFPTSYALGAAQEAGMQLLEKCVKAKKIVLLGTSVGGGSQSKAIESHDFSYAKENKIEYIVWSDRTFDTLSNFASPIFLLVKPIFYLLGIELDCVKAAHKLQKLKIKHFVTYNSLDDVIPKEASLHTALEKLQIRGLRSYDINNRNIRHHQNLSDEAQNFVEQDISQFLGSEAAAS